MARQDDCMAADCPSRIRNERAAAFRAGWAKARETPARDYPKAEAAQVSRSLGRYLDAAEAEDDQRELAIRDAFMFGDDRRPR